MKKRVEWIDVAKGGSIIFVVLFHCTMFLNSHTQINLPFYDLINRTLAPVRMPLFFAISGFLASRALDKKWSEVAQRRIWSLVYLFALWSIIRWTYFRYIQQNAVTPTEGDSVIELAWMWIQPNSGLWFLWCLAIYFFIAKVARRLKAATLTVALTVAVLTWNDIINPDNYVHHNALVYLPFFLIGAWYGTSAAATLEKFLTPLAVLSATVFIATLLIKTKPDSSFFGVVQTLSSFAGLTAGAIAAMILSKYSVVRIPLVYIGSRTLPVYVTHVIVASFIAKMISELTQHYIEWWGVPFIAIFAIAIRFASTLRSNLPISRLFTMRPISRCSPAP